MTTQQLVIIGSGLAGYTLAKEYRRTNKEGRIVILSQDDGIYYSKPLLSTGFAKKKSASDLAMKTAEQMATELDATIFSFHTVSEINTEQNQITAVDNAQVPLTITYENLVFATGASAIQLPFDTSIQDKVFTINDLMDYAKFTDSLTDVKDIAIIGSGLVGTEYATDLTSAGFNVSVISLDAAPLQQLLPIELGHTVQGQLTSDGITWYLQDKVASSNMVEDKVRLTLDSGKQVNCDIVLSAVGLKSRTTLAKDAGIAVNRGIVTDNQLRTNITNVYALGDCAEIVGNVMMYVAPITQSAKILTKVLNGEEATLALPAMPVIVKTPTCPVVSNPPPANTDGQWEITGEGNNFAALFKGSNEQLLGFALTGTRVIDRIKLAKQLPALL